LENIAIYRVHDLVELIALIHGLGKLLEMNPDVGLVVIDSLSRPLESGHHAHGLAILTKLKQLMEQFPLTLICVSKFESKSQNKGFLALLEPPPLEEVQDGMPGGAKSVSESNKNELIPIGLHRWSQVVDIHSLFFWDATMRYVKLTMRI
jgi:hypothetical protein